MREFSAIPIGISGESDHSLAVNQATEQQYHQVAKLSPTSPSCIIHTGCIHLRDLICPPFGHVTIYNTLYIMFSPNKFSKGPE